MTARLMLVAAASLSVATAAFGADPAKPVLRDSVGQSAPRELVLASVDLKSPAGVTDAQAAAPAKHRTARVTTCRCGGDPLPQSEESDSE